MIQFNFLLYSILIMQISQFHSVIVDSLQALQHLSLLLILFPIKYVQNKRHASILNEYRWTIFSMQYFFFQCLCTIVKSKHFIIQLTFTISFDFQISAIICKSIYRNFFIICQLICRPSVYKLTLYIRTEKKNTLCS